MAKTRRASLPIWGPKWVERGKEDWNKNICATSRFVMVVRTSGWIWVVDRHRTIQRGDRTNETVGRLGSPGKFNHSFPWLSMSFPPFNPSVHSLAPGRLSIHPSIRPSTWSTTWWWAWSLTWPSSKLMFHGDDHDGHRRRPARAGTLQASVSSPDIHLYDRSNLSFDLTVKTNCPSVRPVRAVLPFLLAHFTTTWETFKTYRLTTTFLLILGKWRNEFVESKRDHVQSWLVSTKRRRGEKDASSLTEKCLFGNETDILNN